MNTNNKLDRFMLNELIVPIEDQHLSLAQIYSTRLRNKEYFQFVKSYNNLAQSEVKDEARSIAQRKSANEARRRAKEAERKASLAAYRRGIEAKFARMEGNSSSSTSSTFRNSYKLNKQDQAFINATNKNSKLISSQNQFRGIHSPVATYKKVTRKTYVKPKKKVYNNTSKSRLQSNKTIARLMPVFVQKESKNSWPTREQACKYAKNRAISVAKSLCKKEHRGRVATKSESKLAIDVNCQSYRQIKKGTMWDKKGHWKVTGNVILQCRLSN
jgi:hypothetical protein